MKEILKDVYGRRLRVDHPSHTGVTFEGMRCGMISREGGHKYKYKVIHTLIISSVDCSSSMTFALIAPAMADLWGMSSSRTL